MTQPESKSVAAEPVPEVASQEYEFDSAQDALVQSLAVSMKFVGTMLIVFGAVTAVGSLAVMMKLPAYGIVSLVQGLIFIISGAWTDNASDGFKKIATTKGRDMTNLMNALGELLKLYRMQRVMFLIALVTVSVALVVAVLSMGGYIGGAGR